MFLERFHVGFSVCRCNLSRQSEQQRDTSLSVQLHPDQTNQYRPEALPAPDEVGDSLALASGVCIVCECGTDTVCASGGVGVE